jgi:cupin 2 domain-containing protein
MEIRSLYDPVADQITDEVFETLVEVPGARLERIVSRGHATPPGQWDEQDAHEWVVLLSGSAWLRFEGEADPVAIRPGDHVLIPAHRRHRVEATDAATPSVWLALHYRA